MNTVDAHHHVWDLSVRHQLTARYADVHAAARSLTADLSDAEKDAAFRGTAQRTYRLDLTRTPQ